MGILQIVGLGVISTILILMIKSQRPDMAINLTIITGLIIFFIVILKVEGVIKIVEKYVGVAGINTFYFSILLKIIAISYIAEFGSHICKDAGAGAIASKIELSGKVIIVTLSIPIITSLIELILSLGRKI
ncbi:MAG: stage III sporulation protein AD [Clostridiales bacterium]|nr:stage III sporulation protein AD [Clostridiales bacterium]